MPSPSVRRAHTGDISELVRLRAVMLASMHGGDPHEPDAWRTTAAETLHKRLSDPTPTLAAFVINRPTPNYPAAIDHTVGTVDPCTTCGPEVVSHPGLAACAVGVIETRLGGPENPNGQIGYIFNVVTDEDQRRQGFSRACMQALLAWFADRGITRIDLAASDEGEPLYAQLGFKRTNSPRMQLKSPIHPAP